MEGFNKASLAQFTEALRYTDKVFRDASEEHFSLLDRVNKDCRLATEMIVAMRRLTESDSRDAYKKAFNHYRVIIAVWILLNDPDMLQPKH